MPHPNPLGRNRRSRKSRKCNTDARILTDGDSWRPRLSDTQDERRTDISVQYHHPRRTDERRARGNPSELRPLENRSSRRTVGRRNNWRSDAADASWNQTSNIPRGYNNNHQPTGGPSGTGIDDRISGGDSTYSHPQNVALDASTQYPQLISQSQLDNLPAMTYQQPQFHGLELPQNPFSFPTMPWMNPIFPPTSFQSFPQMPIPMFHPLPSRPVEFPFAQIRHMSTVTYPIQPPTFAQPRNPSTTRRTVSPPIAPTPTDEYLANASLEPVSTDIAQPLLVILDLNGTLIHRNRRSAAFVKRPGLENFLNHLFDHYRVMIWTSSKPPTVDSLMRRMFSREMASKFVAIWARDKLGLTPNQYNEKVQVYKRLTQIWDDELIRSKYPDSFKVDTSQDPRWDQRNTVLIDDSRIKAMGQPHNIIEIPEFTNDTAIDEERNLMIVLRQLRILARQQDASRKLRKWGETRKTVSSTLSATKFWESELSKDEKELGLGLEGFHAEATRKKKKKKAKVSSRKILESENIEQQISATQSILENEIHIADDTAQEQTSDVTDNDEDSAVALPCGIVEMDPDMCTTPRTPSQVPS